MTRVRTKICGVRDAATVAAAVAAGADAIGVVFAARSPRTVDAAQAAALASSVPPLVAVVGVFRNQSLADVRSVLAHPGLERLVVQLHGDEDEAFASALGRPFVRALPCDPARLRAWDEHPACLALLVDGPVPGSGLSFDHGELARLRPSLRRPVILAGGLDPENVGAAIVAVRPWAVDVSSGVESAPGVKDPARIAAFCAAVRAASPAD